MSIMSTLTKLYAIACESQRIVHEGGQHDFTFLKTLLGDVRDDEVMTTQRDISELLNVFSNVSRDIQEMKILSITTSADPVNHCIWFNLAIQFGSAVVACNNAFSREGTINFQDGLEMALMMLDPDKNILAEEGNA